MAVTPFLASIATLASVPSDGRTIATRAIETTDEDDPPKPPFVGSGSHRPLLALHATRIEGDRRGKSIVTKAWPETSDEGDDSELR